MRTTSCDGRDKRRHAGVCPNCAQAIIIPKPARPSKQETPGLMKWRLAAAGVAIVMLVAGFLVWQTRQWSTKQTRSMPIPAESKPDAGNLKQTREFNAAQTVQWLENMESSFGGIGTALSKTNGVLLVKEVFASSPAERAGIKAGSKIVSINGEPARNMTLEEVVKLLRGPVGTVVKMEVMSPDGAQRELSLIREKVAAFPVDSKLLDGGLVYIRIRGFNKETPGAVREALTQPGVSKARGIVLTSGAITEVCLVP